MEHAISYESSARGQSQLVRNGGDRTREERSQRVLGQSPSGWRGLVGVRDRSWLILDRR